MIVWIYISNVSIDLESVTIIIKNDNSDDLTWHCGGLDLHWSPAGQRFEPAPNKSLTHAVARPDYTGDDSGEAGADDDDGGGGGGGGDDAGQH